jgi:cytochrome c553
MTNWTSKMIRAISCALVTLFCTNAFAAGDIKLGEQKAQTCQACHGKDGKAVDPYPHLAGQYADYMVQAMKAYKTGTRKNPLMNAFMTAKNEKGEDTYTDKDIENLAAYFASLPSTLDDLEKHEQGSGK